MSTSFVFLTPSGKIIRRSIAWGGSYLIATAVQWTPDGRLIYLSQDKSALVFDDLVSGKVQRIPIAKPYLGIFNWSPDKKHALFNTAKVDGNGNDPFNYQLWLLSLSDGRAELIGDSVRSLGSIYHDFSDTTPAWSPSGNRIVFWNADGAAYYDRAVKRVVQIMRTDAPLNSLSIPKLQLTSDGQNIVLLWNWDVSLYDLKTGSLRKGPGGTGNFEISPDGRYIAISSSQCGSTGACIIDAKDGTLISSILDTSNGYDSVRQFDFLWHPTQPWLFVGQSQEMGSSREYVSVTNVSGTVRREIGLGGLSEGYIGWLPDVTQLDASWGAPNPLSPREPDSELRGFDGWTNHVVWSPDSRQLGVAAEKGSQQLWDVTDAYRPFKVTDGAAPVWNRDGSRVAVQNQGTRRLDARTGDLQIALPAANHIQYNPDGSLFGLLDTDGVFHLYKGVSALELSIDVLAAKPISHFAFNRDGSLITTDAAGNIAWWHITGNDSPTVQILNEHVFATGAAFTLSQNGRYLAISEQSSILNRIVLWDISAQHLIAQLPGTGGMFSPDGTQFALEKVGNPIRLIDTKTGQPSITLENPPYTVHDYGFPLPKIQQVQVLGWNQIGDRLVAIGDYAADPHEIILWDTTGKVLWALPTWHQSPIFDISPDGERLAVVTEAGRWGEEIIEIINLKTGSLLERLNRNAFAVRWSPDGKWLASASSYGVSLWAMAAAP